MRSPGSKIARGTRGGRERFRRAYTKKGIVAWEDMMFQMLEWRDAAKYWRRRHFDKSGANDG